MARAGLFIGVDRTGELPKLNDAAAGAKRMYEWALAQGMADRTHAKLITDAGGAKVEPDQISEAIDEICNGPGVDQLIVYFAGHGVNLQRSDRWLLTDAPAKTYAAVNVLGSVELARTCGIPHVVTFADACRVAPEGIQNQNVLGVEVFPNSAGGDKTNPVDQFVACYLGRTATEVKDPADEAANYSALYTDALLDGLLGTRFELLEPGDAGDTAKYVRPWPLQDYLEAEIPRRVKALKLEHKVNQNPDAIITSRESWVARITGPVATTLGGYRAPAAPAAAIGPPPQSLRSFSRDLTATASEGSSGALDRKLQQGVAEGIPGAARFARTIQRIAQPFGPGHFESQCGVKLRGARIARFVAPLASGSLFDGGSLLRIDRRDGPGVSVLLQLDNGSACVIPVIDGFLAALTVDEGELVDVSYEPSDNTWRWDLYKEHATEVRALRAVAASASHHGRFRLDPNEAEKIGRQMQYAKGIDPTLAVYAAYAYHDVQLDERIRSMSGYLRDDVGVTFFDLALLGRRLVGKGVGRSEMIVPFVPLLAQGWSLLGAHRVKLHPALDGVVNHMQDSLWSLFDSRGAEQLERAMQSGEVR